MHHQHRDPTARSGSGQIAAHVSPACSGYSTTGAISGRLVAAGGPNGSPRLLPGTIHISGGGHEYTIRVPPAAAGTFYTEVPEGTYFVTGRSRLYQSGERDCTTAQTSIQVRADDTVDVDVVCRKL
jgi:hypothetical protein